MSSTVRIMPLGDSITAGFRSEATGGYRAFLARMFAEAGFPVEFVGSMHGPGSSHEGHSGFMSNQITQNVYAWLEANPAEIVLLHIGTNDILQSQQATAIANIEQAPIALAEQFAAAN